MKFIGVTLLISIFSLLASCEYKKEKKNESFETLVLNYDFSQEKYELLRVKINSLNRPRQLKSSVAHFYYNKKTSQSLEDEPLVRLNLVKSSSGFYMPEDLPSLNAVSSYRIYEKLWQHYKKLDILKYSTWPKKVVIQGQSKKLKTNNALHLSGENTTYYLPWDSKELPAHLNPGLVAHEESHGLFYEMVMKDLLSDEEYARLDEFLNREYSDQGESSSTVEQGQDAVMEYNYTFLRALNEGFADYMGYTFSQVPDYVLRSFNFEKSDKLKFNRIVGSSMVAPLPSVDQLQTLINNVKSKNVDVSVLDRSYLVPEDIQFEDQAVAELNTLSLLDLTYRLSGLISTLFNVISQNIAEVELPPHLNKNEYFLQSMVSSMDRLNKTLFVKFKSERLDFYDVWNALFTEQILNNDICRLIQINSSGKTPLLGCETDE